MLRSQGSVSKLRLWTGITVLCLFALFFALPAAAQADFTLTANPFLPDAIAPGGTTASNINVVTNAGFSGSITFSCAVTAPVQLPPEDIPVCTISPTSITAAGGATATITTTTSTSTIGYTVTITGTDGSGTQSQDLQLTVLSVTPQFTITVQSAIAPSSVTAGSGAEGTISINPLDGYMTPSGGYITLYCSSMTPLVTIAPVCSFSYPQGQKGLVVTGNTPESSTLTITTFGPVITGNRSSSSELLCFVAVCADAGTRRNWRSYGREKAQESVGSVKPVRSQRRPASDPCVYQHQQQHHHDAEWNHPGEYLFVHHRGRRH